MTSKNSVSSKMVSLAMAILTHSFLDAALLMFVKREILGTGT